MKRLLVLPLLLLVSCQPVADSIEEDVEWVLQGVAEGLEEALLNSGLIEVE